MLYLKILFWMMVFTVFYTYIGYGLLVFFIIRLRKWTGLNPEKQLRTDYEPEVTLMITAYNEKEIIDDKVRNSLEIDYPPSKIRFVWITDGSDDGTPEVLGHYDGIEVHHLPERNGKIAAMNRGMQFVRTPIVIFSDANAMLSRQSVKRIVALFGDEKVGCVSGEKRILVRAIDTAAGTGEGFYWKYESTLKKWDSELYSVVGAAGELFAIRTELYNEVETDTLLDDFVISLRTAQKGYTIQYDPEAYAVETASAGISEELKRKIRIAAGGMQSLIRLRALLNIFRYGTLSFQYFSHRVLRWTLAPLSLLLLLPAGGVLAFNEGIREFGMYSLLFWFQVFFYLTAFIGWRLKNRSVRFKPIFIPYYFFIMNLCVFLGLNRFLKGSQTVKWEKVKRETG
jgi:cellulose synthase/poly-beta-1,6-N-acetylglucosamine synthase-like glycosyltransferase